MSEYLARILASNRHLDDQQLADLLVAEWRRVVEHRITAAPTPYGERGLRAVTYRRGARDAVH